MFTDDTREILKNIIEGIFITGEADHLTTARNFLSASFSTSTTIEKNFEYQSAVKKKQDEHLRHFILQNNLWLHNYPQEKLFLAQGGEAKVYFGDDNKSVVKLNDAIYYNTWLDFLNSVLIHNLLFEETAYNLLGFTNKDNSLLAILSQPFIIADNDTDLADVKKFLAYNGFENTKRNDYYNKELGLILEDIHDENVIVNSNKLFFIDTVFYINL